MTANRRATQNPLPTGVVPQELAPQESTTSVCQSVTLAARIGRREANSLIHPSPQRERQLPKALPQTGAGDWPSDRHPSWQTPARLVRQATDTLTAPTNGAHLSIVTAGQRSNCRDILQSPSAVIRANPQRPQGGLRTGIITNTYFPSVRAGMDCA